MMCTELIHTVDKPRGLTYRRTLLILERGVHESTGSV